MIVDDTKKLPGALDATESPAGSSAGPSSSALNVAQPPPSFEQSTSDAVIRSGNFPDNDVFVPPGGELPPPAFTPYEATYYETSDGTVVSHDPHLNEDGEAMYRFLLAHAQTPPKLLLHIHGEHSEERTRQVQRTDKNGRTRWHTESERHTVVDFNFHIDISRHVAPVPTHFTIPDSEPAYRGKMYQEVDVFGAEGAYANADIELSAEQRLRRKARRQERKTAEAWDHERAARGLPPWVGPETDMSVVHPVDALVHHTNVLKSSKTVREWADEYCASQKMLKEFTYQKVVYGWNYAALQSAIGAAIQSTFYNGDFTVKFIHRSNKIHVRADNWLSRMLSMTWVKVILWILLIYPFVWLFKRFASEGGGRWEVCGGAYPLKSWQFVAPQQQGSEHDVLPPSYSVGGDTAVVQTDQGAARLVGMREGEWFARWEGTIRRAVTNRLQARQPLEDPEFASIVPAALLLDGYTPPAHSF